LTSVTRADDNPPRRSALAAAWRPGALVYLAFCLAGLAAGLWPQAVFIQRHAPDRGAPLPALKTLLVAQLAFALLAWPLLAMRRGRVRWAEAVAEAAAYLAVAVPFYAAAAYLADAVAADVLRGAIYVACVWTLPLVAGAYLASGRGGGAAVLLLLLVAAFGLPAAHYLAMEFATPAAGELMARLSPASFAWAAAESRQAGWLPRPIWAALIWPGAAAALGCVWLLLPRRRGSAASGAPGQAA
jgi:hypothetical protein